MKKSEIKETKAGEELDKLVANYMGWKYDHNINECEDGFYDYCIYCGYEPRFSDVEPGTCDTPPRYSKEIEYAWQVVEKLAQEGSAPIVSCEKAGEWSCGYWFVGQIKATIGYGNTAPLAICKSVLYLI